MKFINTIYKKHIRLYDALLLVLLSLLGVNGINYTLKLVVGDLFSYSFLSFLEFGLIYVSLWWAKKRLPEIASDEEKALRKHVIFSYVLSFVLGMTLVVGYQLTANKMTDGGFSGKLLIILRSLMVAIPLFPFMSEIVALAGKLQSKTINENESGPVKGTKKVFFFSWIAMFVLWIPVMLAYYPAIMAFDFHRQSWEAMAGFIWFNPYQPLIHTLFIWLSLKVGGVLGSYQLGMAFYSIVQMLIMSAAYAYGVNLVYRLSKRKWCAILTTAFFSLFPFISIMSVGVTKDGIFSACFVVFICMFLERRYFEKEGAQKWIFDVLWILETILLCLFRNNGVYAVAFFAIPFVISSFLRKKERAWTIILCALMIVLGKSAPGLLQNALGSEIGAQKAEMYSVVIQQLSRVGYYHGEDLDFDDQEKLQKIISEEYYMKYNPPLADTVKGNVSADNFPNYWADNMGDVLKEWIHLGLLYPNDYVDAFLEVTRGYWLAGDKSFAECFGTNEEERVGSITTYTFEAHDELPDGIPHETKFAALETKLEDMATRQRFYNWPILSVLFMPSLYTWLLLSSFVLLIRTKQKDKLLIYFFPIAYFLTQLLGPVVRVRYALPLMVALPVLLALWLKDVPKAEYKKEWKTPVLLLLSVVSTFAINYVWKLRGGDSFSFSIYPLLTASQIFVMGKLFWEKIESEKADASSEGKPLKKRLIFTGIMVGIFGALMVMGFQLSAHGMSESGFKGKGLILIRGLLLSAPMYPFFYELFGMSERAPRKKKASEETQKKGGLSDTKRFFVYWGITFLLWIPAFLAYYPAIMAFDFHRQSQEAVMGFEAFNSYQPLIHTLFIWLSFQFGNAFGSYEIGMAFYSIIQMLIVSACLSYATVVVNKLTEKKWPTYLSLAFMGLYPYISVISVGATKDIIFGGLFALFTALLIERTYFATGKKKLVIDACWVLEAGVMCLFRANAVYAIAVFAVLLLAVSGIRYLVNLRKKKNEENPVFETTKEWLKMAVILLLMVVLGISGPKVLKSTLGSTASGGAMEKYSVIIQPLGRVGYYHKEALDADTFDKLDRLMHEGTWEKYNPHLADSVKWDTQAVNYPEYWEGNMKNVLLDFVSIGVHFPNEYIDAELETNAGLWNFEDKSWAEVYNYDVLERHGALNTFTSSESDLIPEGIVHETKWAGMENLYESLISTNGFYDFPAISMLFKPAIFGWFMVLGFILMLRGHDKKKIMIWLFSFLYFCTILLGPVVQIRYVYPIMVVTPLLLALFGYRSKEALNESE